MKTDEVANPDITTDETVTDTEKDSPPTATSEKDTQESEKLSGADATEEIEEVADEEVIEAWNDIYSTLKEMSVDWDIQGIMDFTGDSEENAINLAKFLTDVSYYKYDSQNTYIVWSNKKYYLVETVEYRITYEQPRYAGFSRYIEKIDGEWRINNTNEVMEEVNESFFETIYGPEYLNALRAGRNCRCFGSYMFTHPEKVFNGCFETQVISAWQNEDGTMDIQFYAANGTNDAHIFKSVNITLTDDILGTICDISPVEYWYSIPPGRSKIFTVHVNLSRIRTRTSTWRNVQPNIYVSIK